MQRIEIYTLTLVIILLYAVNGQLVPNFPTVPINTAKTPGTVSVQNHWSQVAVLSRPNVSQSISGNELKINCPHLETGTVNWEAPSAWNGGTIPQANGSAIQIAVGKKVVIRSTSLLIGIYGIITIPSTSHLILDDANITLNTMGIKVDGRLAIGGPTCRIRNYVNITLHGTKPAVVPADVSIKGIAVSGTLDIHAQVYAPTWTRLATTAAANSLIIFLQDLVNWQIGQTIVITTTVLKDSRDYTQNEIRKIAAINTAPNLGPKITALTLDKPLNYTHYGGREYQAEVALLSRQVSIQGSNLDSNPKAAPVVCNGGAGQMSSNYPCPIENGFGGHVFIAPGGIGRVRGVQLTRMGQTNVMGRYPFHFHMLGAGGVNSYIRDSSFHQSFYRCVSVHGTNGTLVSNNVGYDIVGHCYYLEDGVEENNTVEYNLGAFVHFLGPPIVSTLFKTSRLDWVYQNTTSLLVPSDMAASPFYISNSYNIFRGNAASGGWSGYIFPDFTKPLGLSENVPISPSSRTVLLFDGNSAHSTGFWSVHAGAVYVGGKLEKDIDGRLRYIAGRSGTHETCSVPLDAHGGCSEANQQWMKFTNVKTFLANRGIIHWGSRSEFSQVESHDAGVAVKVFGKVWVDKMYAGCRSQNVIPFINDCPAPKTKFGAIQYWLCHPRDLSYWQHYQGFEFYDTNQKHIITKSTFQNCTVTMCLDKNSCNTDSPWTFLSGSNEFLPQIMQASAKILYTNTNTSRLWRYNQRSRITVSGRLQSLRDTDGTASLNPAGSTIIGSSWADDWWKIGNACKRTPAETDMWACSVAPSDIHTGSLIIEAYANQSAAVGVTQCGTGLPCPAIGFATHILRNSSLSQIGLNVTVNSKLTGPISNVTGGGWYVRFFAGAPKSLTVKRIQLENENRTLILALPYPPNTTFSIYANASPSCRPSAKRVCTWNFTKESSLSSLYKRVSGDGYFWDNLKQVLYVQVISQWDSSLGEKGVWDRTRPLQESFTRAGITIAVPRNSIISINANCTSNSVETRFCKLPSTDFDTVRSAV
ncbi:Fibrocystin-L [Nowakowskiella sp. JEL0407]|nr:Fibrocystin-L [Nowakowskiella sp. JEL0407]